MKASIKEINRLVEYYEKIYAESKEELKGTAMEALMSISILEDIKAKQLGKKVVKVVPSHNVLSLIRKKIWDR